MIGEDAYAGIVSELKGFLEKGRAGLLKELTEKMIAEAAAERFEEAARIRSRIEALGSMKKESVRYVPAGESEELGSMLGLDGPPETIEAFDVSNIMGKEAAGSMVSFFKGRPRKGGYRKFRIGTVDGVDDYSMMREIVRRRYGRLVAEKGRPPDLIVIDGGKGHLAAAAGELEKLGLGGTPVIGIAKEFERIYRKGSQEPLVLPRDSKALHLLERIRDEAHRFAIKYHKGLRSKKAGISELDGVPGIGGKRKKALLERFGSVEGVRAAGLGELCSVKGIDEKSAKSIIAHLAR
jgi:excinuclease ABC subunit C